MFDYQAGEKYKLTLIMVGLAGLMAGIFFTILLIPSPEPARHRASAAYMQSPDITGRAEAVPAAGAAQALTPAAAPSIDPDMCKSLVQGWLPLAWDLSAGSAKQSQEKAMAYMTPECAAAYQQNIWTPDLAKQIDESGLKSSFRLDKIDAQASQMDGGVIVYVEGAQTLMVPGKGASERPVKLEYMIKPTSDGLRISGISEGVPK